MSTQTWALFALTETALCLTPGPAVLLVVAQALRYGSRASAWSTLGILSGNIMYFALAATGVGAMLVASYEMFSAVRLIGAGYLVWLGLRAFRRASRTAPATPSAAARGRGRMVLSGFVLQAANPKALLFFTALLPQFVDPRGDVVAQMLVLGITSVVIELIVLLGYGAGAGWLFVLTRDSRVARIFERATGTLLITAGIGLAVARRP